MPWFKIDDQLAFHPKAIAAGNAAIGLWVRAGSWSAAQLTDGAIPAHMIGILGAKTADANKLVRAGLWDVTDAGYQFHDWADHNPSRAEVKEARHSRSASATLANHNRWHRDRGITDLGCAHCRGRSTDQSTDQPTDRSTDRAADQ